MLHYRRNQRPVGHGCFHSGHLWLEGEPEVFRYIYDCGAKRRHYRESEINAYLAMFPGEAKLDVLFISHLHADHVNGLNHLLASVKCDTAVIPYVSPFERLCFVTADVASGSPDFDRLQFVLDPVGWLSVRGVGTIIVASGEEGGPSLPGPGPSMGPNEFRDRHGIRLDLKPGKPISPKQAGTNPIISGAPSRSTSVRHLIHTMPLLLDGPSGSTLTWEFLTYVHPEDKRMQMFRALVRNEFPKLAAVLQKNRLRFDTRPLIDILKTTAQRNVLVQIFRHVFPSLNATSLCLYSGPSPSATDPNIGRLARACLGHGIANDGHVAHPAECRALPIYESWQALESYQPRCGWLGTGDSELSSPERRRLFLEHYAKYTNNTTTFLLPHHGSRDNFHEQIAELRIPLYSVAAPSGSTHHPHREVLRSIRRANCLPVVTTNIPTSALCECGVLKHAYRAG